MRLQNRTNKIFQRGVPDRNVNYVEVYNYNPTFSIKLCSYEQFVDKESRHTHWKKDC